MYRCCGKTWTDEAIERIRQLIAANPSALRAELARRVCEEFDWLMHDGRLKVMSCRVAMLRMHRAGLINLPAASKNYRRPYNKLESAASDPQSSTEIALSDLKALTVELVKRGPPLRLWNEFIARYHYLGYKPMGGAQLRYFIREGDQILGAMGFGAAAWKVAPRDQFIGWSPAVKEHRLHLVVNQTRFLILPWVRCQNLATKTLAMVTRRLPDDWAQRYGYRPLLMETFVDLRRPGTCYKASNWTRVGETKGRSKYDRHNACASPVKSIWLMPLHRKFRTLLAAEAGE